MFRSGFVTALLCLCVPACEELPAQQQGPAGLPLKRLHPGLKDRGRFQVQWGEVVNRKGNLLIRGTLLINSGAGDACKPVDWSQKVRVVLAINPGIKPDWRKRYDFHTAVWADGVARAGGTFVVRIPISKIHRVLGRKVPYQAGICLATNSGGYINWMTSVLPQTVRMILVPGPRPLNRTLQLINATTWVQGSRDHNPKALIQAVNHLRSLGKTKAIAALREFLEIAGENRRVKRDPANIDTANRTCVFLIVRLLFRPKNAGEDLPDFCIGSMISSAPQGMKLPDNPLFPLVVRHDIPLLLPVGILLGGLPEDPEAHVKWAEQHGKLREKPLRPADNPLAVADGLLDGYDQQLLRQQAWRMIEHLAGPWRPSKDPPDAVWKKHKERARKLKIRWDEKKQEYVAVK